MSSTLFIALPLLFGFATSILMKFGRNGVAYSSLLLQFFLFYLSLSLLSSASYGIEIISIAPPLGISFVVNQISLLFVTLFTFVMLIFSLYYLSYRKVSPYENESKFFILLNMLLAASIGLVLSGDIFNIYVFFEIAGVSAYILSAYKKTPLALEAGLKYLLTGAMASIFLIFAIFLIYMNIGSLNLTLIAENFQFLPYNLKFLISLLVLIGFGFKVEIFPFNFWVSDIYEGSTSLINSLFSAIVVKAYLFVFFHIFYLFLPDSQWSLFLVYLGALSMLIAEVVALRQTNLKRLFAYSSLGQIGFIFATFALQNSEATQAALFIVFAHSLAKLIVFLALSSISKEYGSLHIDVLKKFNSSFLKVTLLIAMLSLLGIPLLAGFVGKLLALKSFATNEMFSIVAIILVASLIEATYYFRVAGLMFVKNDEVQSMKIDFSQKLLFSFLLFLLILIGIAPFLFSELFLDASKVMLGGVA